ncbi:TonB family protein [Flavihumibacter sp. R14]|nr:TonB family protein [Flavihumibacter soli]
MMRPRLLSHYLIIVLLTLSFSGFSKAIPAIDSIEVVFKDTIHVHGKVVDEQGKPLRGIEVSSGYYKGLVRTLTKADGNFLLKNVQPNDTIFFSSGNRQANIYHEGSRILNVVLPELRNRGLEGTTVTAKRKVPKQPKNSIIKLEVSGGTFPNEPYGPQPYGGYSRFEKDLQTKLIYPEKARMANIEGMVKMEFIIDSLGKPTDFKTIQGLGYGCEEAVIEAMKATKWKTGVSSGYPWAPTMSVKVLFKLEDL